MDNDLERTKEFLLNDPSVVFAYLFGSRAKGISNHKSDWDFGIYFTQKTMDNPWYDFMLEAKLSHILKSEVQIVSLNKTLPPLLGFEIAGRGLLLFEKDKNLKLEYENRILRNYFDWKGRQL